MIALSIFPTYTAAWSLSEWLRGPGYTSRGDPNEEILCYALPYGGIGFVSHLLTYYTILCLKFGRTPFVPWRVLNEPVHSIIFATCGLVVTVIINILTTIRCRQSWEFVLISLWKMTLSLSQAAITIHAMVVVRKLEPADWRYTHSLKDELGEQGVLNWLYIYSCGIVLGLIGLCSLVAVEINSNGPLRDVTIAFGILASLSFGVLSFFLLDKQVLKFAREEGDGFWSFRTSLHTMKWVSLSAMIAIGFLLALYSDFALAAIANSWAGAPSSDDEILFWVYFFAKRLPMLSF